MNARKRAGSRVWLGLVVAAALGATFAPSASAAPLIDPSQKGSLTVVKYEADNADKTAGDGTKQTTLSGTPLKDANFVVSPVATDLAGEAIDLTTPEGWDAAAKLTVANVSGHLGTALPTGTTDDTGTVVFSKLPVGLYYVFEAAPTADAKPLIPGTPFLVTIPMTNPSDTTWMYDIWAYPKNDVLDVQKALSGDPAQMFGDQMTYSISSHVPYDVDGSPIESYVIEDDLDPALAFVSSTDLTLVSKGGTVLETFDPGTDYTLVTAQGTPLPAPTAVTWTLTQPGLDKITKYDPAPGTADPEMRIKTSITVKVTAYGTDGPGPILNSVSLTTKFAASSTPPTTVTSPPVEVDYGRIKLTKVDATATAKTLAGAVFDLYAADPSSSGSTPIAQGLTTGGDGVLTIDGLLYDEYWLVETKAPDHYELEPAPIHLTAA
ncbi:MAG: SpaH/EbpB family LPXTG-anchored major pilin, partial [Promicromonosporaceae bacterium]|nr:SpaH/EbpB family LPXTG-anchored major pilin [Promicromonosporaceae bacterium]